MEHRAFDERNVMGRSRPALCLGRLHRSRRRALSARPIPPPNQCPPAVEASAAVSYGQAGMYGQVASSFDDPPWRTPARLALLTLTLVLLVTLLFTAP